MTDRGLVRVLVCGNLDREDDGVAARAWARLEAAAHPDQTQQLDVIRCDQLDVTHLLPAGPRRPMLIADCAVGVAPGEVVALPLRELLVNPRGPAPHSSHALPVDQVLGIAAALLDEPPEGMFVGIGGERFGHGRTLSSAVRGGLPVYVAALRTVLNRFGRTGLEGPS